MLFQTLSVNQRAVLAEIRDVLRVLCHTHRLPLALTWIPCSYVEGVDDETMRVRRGYNAALNEKLVLCIEDSACYVNDKDMESFVHACAEHFLEDGQGIAGKALQSNRPFFYSDVKEYHVNEYPLVHHARKFGLNAVIAIRLRSTYTGDNDYILEMFLPLDMKQSSEHQMLLNELSVTIQKICKSLRTVSDTELLKMEDSEIKVSDMMGKTVCPRTLCRSYGESPNDGELSFDDRLVENASEVTGAYLQHEQVSVHLILRSLL